MTKFLAPGYSDYLNAGHDAGGKHRKMTGESYPSQLTAERTELFELQWRDGHPVEQPVLDHRSDNVDHAGDVSSPWVKENMDKADGLKGTATGEAVEDWWKLWREGEGGGACTAAALGYPQVDHASSSPATVNAKAATARGVGPRKEHATADDSEEERWRLWREGHGSSTPQDSACKNSVLKGEDASLPSSAWSQGCGAQRHSSEQDDQQCSKLDHAIEYMKSLQQQIQVLSSSGYCMQPLLLQCNCSRQYPHPAVHASAVPGAANLYPALPLPPPPPPPPPAAAPLYPALPPLHPAAAASLAELNPVTVAVVGPPPAPGGVIGISAGLADEVARPARV